MKRIIILTLLILALTACASAPVNVAMPEIDTGIDTEAWATVPAGEFLMGQHEHETLVDYDYEIMITNVTNAQFTDYLNEAVADGTLKIVDNEVLGYYPGDVFHEHHHEEEIAAGDWVHIDLDVPELRLSYDGETFEPLSGYDNHPMTMVTWFGAQAYCEYNEARLPTEVEWEKAARGTDARAYPWGNEIARNSANFYSSHDLFEKISGKAGDTTPVGFYNGDTYDGYETLDSPSPYGLYDMAGNVWQWTGDVYEGQHYRYMRGGSKADYGYVLRVWMRNNAGPTYYSINVGFRCVR